MNERWKEWKLDMQHNKNREIGGESPHVSMSDHIMLEAGLSSAHACATISTGEKVVRVRCFEEAGSSAFGELFTPSQVLPCVSLAEGKVSAWLGRHIEAARLAKLVSNISQTYDSCLDSLFSCTCGSFASRRCCVISQRSLKKALPSACV